MIRRVIPDDIARGAAIFLRGKDPRGMIFEEERELLQGPGKLAGGVLVIIHRVIRPEDILHAGAPQIAFEVAVRVVEIADDLLKTGEILDEVRREFGIRDEKARQRSILDGPRGIGIKPAFGKRDDVLVAEDFEVRVGEGFPQQSDRRQGEDEVPDGSAADDEDARLHGRMTTTCRAVPPRERAARRSESV